MSFEMILKAGCAATPAAVYDRLTDLPSHLDWGGRQQRRSFRLVAMEGAAPAGVGTEFRSQGALPMNGIPAMDHSVVVAAEPSAVFEFHTDSVTVGPRGGRSEMRWEHRYEIRPDGDGSQVTYRLRLVAATNPPLRMRLPIVRTMTRHLMIPMLCRRGFDNLLRAAESAQAAA